MAAEPLRDTLPKLVFRRDTPTQTIPFVQSSDGTGGFADAPGTRGILVDQTASKIGIQVSAWPCGKPELARVCASLLHYALAALPANSVERRHARLCWALAAIRLEQEQELSTSGATDVLPAATAASLDPEYTLRRWENDHERIFELAINGHAAYPLRSEDMARTRHPATTVTDGTPFSQRRFSLLGSVERAPPQQSEHLKQAGVSNETVRSSAALPDTDGAATVLVDSSSAACVLWVTVHSRQAVHGLLQDGVAALAAALVRDISATAAAHILLGCLCTDLHSWKIHRYADNPWDQEVDISPARQYIRSVEALFRS